LRPLLRRAWALLATVLLLVGGIILAPFTELGSRLIVHTATLFLPVEIDYSGGSLFGEIRLSRLRLETNELTLELHQVEAALDVSCLGRNTLCFESLSVGDIALHWQGGHWRNGATRARISLSRSQIVIEDLWATNAYLEIEESAAQSPAQRPKLPLMSLPFDLVVKHLRLEQVQWKIYGQQYQQASISLGAHWSGTLLVLDEVQIDAEDGAVLQMEGDIRFSDDWPITLAGAAAWDDEIVLAKVLDLPEAFVDVSLLSPWKFSLDGTIAQQDFVIDAAIKGLGYQALQVTLQGRYSPSGLVVDGIELRDHSSGSALQGRGELVIGETSHWTLSVESSHFVLPTISQQLSGQVGGQLTASGSYADVGWTVAVSDIDLSGDINDLPAHIAGRITVNEALRITDSDLQMEINGATLNTDGVDVSLVVDDLGLWLPDSSGRLALSARVMPGAQSVDFQAQLHDLVWRDFSLPWSEFGGTVARQQDERLTAHIDFTPLSADAAATLLPDNFILAGMLELSVDALWDIGSAPLVSGELRLAGGELRMDMGENQTANIAWDDALMRFDYSDTALQLFATIEKGGKTPLSLNLLLPAQTDGALGGEIFFTQLELQLFQPFFPALASLKGTLDGHIKLAGTAEQPLGYGVASVADGAFLLVGNPTTFEALQLQLTAQGNQLEVEGGLRVGEGDLEFLGSLVFSPEPLLELRLAGHELNLLFPPSTQVQVSHDIVLRATPDYLDLTGSLTVLRGVLEHEQLPVGAVALSDDVVNINYEGHRTARRPSFQIGMDVQVTIADEVEVVGSVVDVVVGGDLHLLQKRGQPLQLFGNLMAVDGELRAYKQSLKVTRGTLTFSGAPENPTLDIRAERVIARDNVTVALELRGTLENPELVIDSDPVMPQTETLSYLVRGRGLDAGASSDGDALALSMGTSLVNQTGVLRSLDKVPGINNVELSAQGADDDTTATLGGYIGNRIYLSYGVGLYAPINVVTARLYLQTRLWMEVVSSLENSIDLYYAFDFE